MALYGLARLVEIKKQQTAIKGERGAYFTAARKRLKTRYERIVEFYGEETVKHYFKLRKKLEKLVEKKKELCLTQEVHANLKKQIKEVQTQLSQLI